MQLRYHSSHLIVPRVLSVFVITIEELDCPWFMCNDVWRKPRNIHTLVQWSHASVGLAQARPNQPLLILCATQTHFGPGNTASYIYAQALTSSPPKFFHYIMDSQPLNNNNQLPVHPFYTSSCFLTLVGFVNHIVVYVDIHSSMNPFALVLQPYSMTGSWLGRIEELLPFVGTWHVMPTLADVHTYCEI